MKLVECKCIICTCCILEPTSVFRIGVNASLICQDCLSDIGDMTSYNSFYLNPLLSTHILNINISIRTLKNAISNLNSFSIELITTSIISSIEVLTALNVDESDCFSNSVKKLVNDFNSLLKVAGYEQQNFSS